MWTYAVKRILSIIPILLGVSFLIFLIVYLIPGDPVVKILGQAATPENVAALRKQLGLDQPFLIQYFQWLTAILHGDLGSSLSMRIPVADVLFPKLINTWILTAGSLFICVTCGVLLGIFSGLKQGSWLDKTSMSFAQFGANVPEFWFGIMLMWLFAVTLGWLPASGMYDLRNEGSLSSLLEHLILPAFAGSMVSLAVITRMTRNSVIEVMNLDFIKTLRGNGLPERLIIFRHVLRNILAPVMNITGLQIGYLLSGALVIEQVFNWPGVGTQLYTSITAQDIPMIQAGVLFVAFSFVVVNLITDLLVAALNPRLSK